MQKLLLSTALVASSMIAGAAFAQDAGAQYSWIDLNGNAVQGSYADYQAYLQSKFDTTAGGAFDAPVNPGSAPTSADYDTDGTAGLSASERTAYDTAVATYNTQLAAYNAYNDYLLAANVTSLSGPYGSESLLDGILADADQLSASLSNVAQNLNNIDGSIDITTDRAIDQMGGVITALTGENPGFGSYSQVSGTVFGSDLPASLLDVLDPLTLTLGNLSTTAIGSLQSGNMTATIDADGILAKASSTAGSLTTDASITAEQYSSIADTLAFQNVSINSGAIDGSINMALNDVNATIGNLGTTAIGALGSGAMTANITGQLGTTTGTASDLVTKLVGP